MTSDPAALAVLSRISRSRRPPVDGERCEMCAEPIGSEHSHVVNLTSRSLLCACRGCYLLFTDAKAQLRYRSVPDRYLTFTGLELGPERWAGLDIPVGVTFLFRNSALDQVVAFYPGPAGATESELPLGAWDEVLVDNPGLSVTLPDVEALLLNGTDPARVECYLVPIDVCYELVGRLRQVWRGFDGGHDARAQIAEFFAMVRKRGRQAPAARAAQAETS